MRTNQAKIPTLRSIEDARGGVDLEKVFNLSQLYELAAELKEDEHTQRMGHWHPSACGACKRAQVLQFLRRPATDEFSDRMQDIFDTGHAMHDMVQSKLEQLTGPLGKRGVGYEFVREVPYDPATDQLFQELHVGGTCDGILRIWNDSFEQRGTVEIKSQNDKRHKELLKLKLAWPRHLLQGHLYAYRNDTPIIWFFYLNKNDSKHEVRLHIFEWEIFDRAILYFVECNEFVASGELPPREESYLECKECPYRSMCDPGILKRKVTPHTSSRPIRPGRARL